MLDIEASALASQFDVIVCSEVIEHLADRNAAFANLARMVAPGGLLLATIPQGPIFPMDRHFGHKKHPSKDEMDVFGSLYGLELRGCLESGYPLYHLLKIATNLSPESSLKWSGFKNYSWWQRSVLGDTIPD